MFLVYTCVHILHQLCLATFRLYLGYHTWAQCVVGLLTGLVAAMLWFYVVQTQLTPLFPVITSW